MPTFAVISGLPGSGKTTLARELALSLGADHLDKDNFLEALFERDTVTTPERRNSLSRVADVELKNQALLRQFAVLSSWWRHPASTAESGTPISWLLEPGVKVIEVHCKCSVAVAVSRFTERRRHAGHMDAARTSESLVRQFSDAERLGPLFPSHALVCNTEGHVSSAAIRALATAVRHLASAASEA